MPWQEVGPGLGQEDDRLGRLELGEEEPLVAGRRAPLVEQLQRRPRHAGIALRLATSSSRSRMQVDQVELDRRAAGDLPLGVLGLGVAVEVDRLAPALDARSGGSPSTMCQCSAGSSKGEFRIGCGTS